VRLICVLLLLAPLSAPLSGAGGEDLTQYVEPFMGVIGRGSCVIGPQLPFGSINPSPDTPDGHTDGYDYLKEIRGFSQVHVSGTGGPGKYGQFLISPQIGIEVSEVGHDSKKSEEEARVPYYKVRLTRYDILCEIVPTHHAAMYRFTFPASDETHILIDLGHNIPGDITRKHLSNTPSGGYANSGEVQIDSQKGLITGWGHYWGGWSCEPFDIYFAAEFSRPGDRFGTWKDDRIEPGSRRKTIHKKKERVGAYFGYKTRAGETILLRIAVSMHSVEKAQAYLREEIPHWDFERIRRQGEEVWNERLNRIQIDGATEEQKAIFYTCLYNTMRMPRDRTGDNPKWESTEPYWDDHYAVWDTWRTVFPLHVLINEGMVRDNIRAFIDRHKHNGRVLDAFIAGNDRVCGWATEEQRLCYRNQGGDDVDNVIADAFVKGISGVDLQQAYQVVRHSAEWERTQSYRSADRGWVPYGTYQQYMGMECSRSLEFSYNDFCVAQIANGLGLVDDYQRYLRRSRNWESLWNPHISSDGFSGFIAPRMSDGAWLPYDPKRSRPPKGTRCFYEGTSWVYSFFLPHDFAELISLMGGAEQYVNRLQHALTAKMIDNNNEPAFLTPWAFVYGGRPDLASYWVRSNLPRYTLERFPGDEDSGAMASWFVFAAMGLFPNAGQDLYLLQGPLYPRMTLTRENGSEITIIAVNAGEENCYVQSAELNGEPLNQAWITHTEIKDGATLRFLMGPAPSDWGKQTPPLSTR
jgi:predicted alpha-1,2-mannosidase